MLPPRFNRYEGGGTYGNHIDNALFALPGTASKLRSDVSTTVFLSDPDEYEGGELEVEGPFGVQSVKLAAGDMVLYPSTSLHEVSTIHHGTRFASFFWVQSLIREDSKRHLLFNLDESIRNLRTAHGDTHAEVMKLTNIYHNLIRMWAEL